MSELVIAVAHFRSGFWFAAGNVAYRWKWKWVGRIAHRWAADAAADASEMRRLSAESQAGVNS